MSRKNWLRVTVPLAIITWISGVIFGPWGDERFSPSIIALFMGFMMILIIILPRAQNINETLNPLRGVCAMIVYLLILALSPMWVDSGVGNRIMISESGETRLLEGLFPTFAGYSGRVERWPFYVRIKDSLSAEFEVELSTRLGLHQYFGSPQAFVDSATVFYQPFLRPPLPVFDSATSRACRECQMEPIREKVRQELTANAFPGLKLSWVR